MNLFKIVREEERSTINVNTLVSTLLLDEAAINGIASSHIDRGETVIFIRKTEVYRLNDPIAL